MVIVREVLNFVTVWMDGTHITHFVGVNYLNSGTVLGGMWHVASSQARMWNRRT